MMMMTLTMIMTVIRRRWQRQWSPQSITHLKENSWTSRPKPFSLEDCQHRVLAQPSTTGVPWMNECPSDLYDKTPLVHYGDEVIENNSQQFPALLTASVQRGNCLDPVWGVEITMNRIRNGTWLVQGLPPRPTVGGKRNTIHTTRAVCRTLAAELKRQWKKKKGWTTARQFAELTGRARHWSWTLLFL